MPRLERVMRVSWKSDGFNVVASTFCEAYNTFARAFLPFGCRVNRGSNSNPPLYFDNYFFQYDFRSEVKYPQQNEVTVYLASNSSLLQTERYNLKYTDGTRVVTAEELNSHLEPLYQLLSSGKTGLQDIFVPLYNLWTKVSIALSHQKANGSVEKGEVAAICVPLVATTAIRRSFVLDLRRRWRRIWKTWECLRSLHAKQTVVAIRVQQFPYISAFTDYITGNSTRPVGTPDQDLLWLLRLCWNGISSYQRTTPTPSTSSLGAHPSSRQMQETRIAILPKIGTWVM